MTLTQFGHDQCHKGPFGTFLWMFLTLQFWCQIKRLLGPLRGPSHSTVSDLRLEATASSSLFIPN